MRDISRQEKFGAVKEAIAGSIKGSNDMIADSFHHAISNLPEIHQWKLSQGDLTRSVTKGQTTKLDVKKENTYGG